MRLIDADAFKEELKENYIFYGFSCLLNDFYVAIDEAPTIEPKRGKWIDLDDQWGFEGTFKCSACGELWSLIDGTPQDNGMNFCPNCGADMGEREGE